MKKFYWTGICRQDRTQALQDITSVISRFGAVVNFLRYSDLALGITIAAPEAELPGFYKQLEALIQMDGFSEAIYNSSEEVLVLLHVSFLTGTGDLEIGNIQFCE